MPTSEWGAVPVVWREGVGGYVGAEGLRGAEGMCGLWEGGYYRSVVVRRADLSRPLAPALKRGREHSPN